MFLFFCWKPWKTLPRRSWGWSNQWPENMSTWVLDIVNSSHYHPQHVFGYPFLTGHPPPFLFKPFETCSLILQKHTQKRGRSTEFFLVWAVLIVMSIHEQPGWPLFLLNDQQRVAIHPWRLTWNIIFMEVWFRWFSFLLMGDGWVRFLSPFSSSRVFQVRGGSPCCPARWIYLKIGSKRMFGDTQKGGRWGHEKTLERHTIGVDGWKNSGDHRLIW